MPKSPTASKMDYSLGTSTFSGLGVHVSLLWLTVLFVLVSVIVIGYAGQQEHLAKRELPDTDVNGNLEVSKGISNPTGVVGPSSSVEVVAAGAFSPLALVANTTYFVTGTITASALTLPAGARVGDAIVIKMVSATLAALMVANGAALSIATPSGETFETNSHVLSQDFAAATNGSAQLGMTNDAVVSAAGNNTLTFTGETAGGPGNGTEIICTKISSSKWLLTGKLFGAGAATGAIGDTAAFSTA